MSEKILYNKPRKKQTKINVWMAFPGIYSFALSSLGYMWLFKSIDMLEDVNAEMICTDTKKTSLMIKEVDLIGFSFSFDLDFLNIFKILQRYKIPFKSKDRTSAHPIIFGGGPVLSSNPEPFCEFFDFIIIGDGEETNLRAVEICKENADLDKSKILKKLTRIEGIYVPDSAQKTIKKSHCELSQCISSPILSEKSFFKNTFIIEIARGCANRCGFCLASYLNLPARFISRDEIIKTIDFGLEHTGKIALLGALISAHPKFEDICKYISLKASDKEIEMSISSLRADSIAPEVVKTLVKCGQKHATIAIEAGSTRLRKVINKNLKEEQILQTVKTAREGGLKGLKIYAMIGLPTETKEDLIQTVNLAKKIKSQNKGFDLTFSFSTFVPKPHTPFQWCKRDDVKILGNKINYLKKEFHKLGIKVRFSSPKWDYWQALLSRGSRKLADYLVRVYELGANAGAFKTAYREFTNKKLLPCSDFFALREYDTDEKLPWDFIQIPPGKEFLKKEYFRLLKN